MDRERSITGRTEPRRPTRLPAFGMRSTPEWREWAARLAEYESINFSDLIARALARYAREVGFPEAPPKR